MTLKPGQEEIYIRSMYVAPPGKVLVQVDLSQAESWIVAFLANEPNMKHALMFGDIHTQTAGSALFNEQPSNNPWCPHDWLKEERKCRNCGRVVEKTGRYVGKRYNHASAYRMGPERAAQLINKDSDKPPFITITIKESKKFSEAWHKFYSLRNWWDEIEYKLSTNNRTLTTVYGRERQFFAQWGNELFKEATAFEPQSTVADHFDGAICPELGCVGGVIAIYEQIIEPQENTGEIKIVNQSHDSCIIECPYSIHREITEKTKSLLLRPLVIKGEEFTIPVDAEIGERWGEMEPYE